jgi:prevent-host-death family protein
MKLTAREARDRFSEILDRAARGEEVVVTRRGRPVVRLSPVNPGKRPRLPNLRDFRASIQVRGTPLSEVLLTERKGARY